MIIGQDGISVISTCRGYYKNRLDGKPSNDLIEQLLDVVKDGEIPSRLD